MSPDIVTLTLTPNPGGEGWEKITPLRPAGLEGKEARCVQMITLSLALDAQELLLTICEPISTFLDTFLMAPCSTIHTCHHYCQVLRLYT